MARIKTITGLDIGSSKIKVLVVNQEPQEKKLEAIFQLEEISAGVRRGVVVGVERVSQILRNIFLRISKEGGQNINSVYVNVNGSHIFSTPSRGLVSVSRADQKISEEDIQRVLQAARAINLSSNKEIFETIAKEFIVDGEKTIKEPLGFEGVRLEAEVLTIGGFSPYLKNLSQSVLDADLEILDMIPSTLAAAKSVLTERQKELGVGVLDIGGGTTGFAVFEEGHLIHLAILPMGSSNITNDIAIGLKTDIDVAERIKIEFGSCVLKGKNIRHKIDIGEEELLVFSQKLLAKIITDRISEIFEEANKELKKISKEKLLPAGIVLTGGGAKLPRTIELAKRKFNLPCRLGKPKGILGIKDGLGLSTVCGLVLQGAEEEKGTAFEFGKGISSKIKKIFKTFIP
jgi:cell division protein FtsA